MTNLKSITTEDLKATLNIYRINRTSLKTDKQLAALTLAEDVARELESRIGPNEYSAIVRG